MYFVIVNVKNIKLACYIIRLRYICLSTIINCFVNLTSSLIDSYHQPCTHNFLSTDDNPAPEATMFLISIVDSLIDTRMKCLLPR